MKEALFYKKLENNLVECNLCPWNCRLNPGQTGNCKVRSNENGRLVTGVYNRIAALGVDPVEKKPLYHFYPGRNILSVGEVGCNLHCTFCQNHRISQCYASEFKNFHQITAGEIAAEATKTFKNIGLAFTYNEPFTFYEFMLESAQKNHQNGLKNVVVSNGYINTEPLKMALPFLDAFNIDLKAFSNDFYKKFTKGKLGPVLQTLKIIAESKAHLEVTNLVIPGLNDDENEFETMVKWIKDELGDHIPFHLSRYFPQHELRNPPTPIKTLKSFYEMASQHLQFVYLGNVFDEKRSSTYCPHCGAVLVERNRYRTTVKNLDEEGRCSQCKTEIYIFL